MRKVTSSEIMLLHFAVQHLSAVAGSAEQRQEQSCFLFDFSVCVLHDGAYLAPSFALLASAATKCVGIRWQGTSNHARYYRVAGSSDLWEREQ